MSGTFDIKRFIFGHYDDDCYYNNPFDYLPELNDDFYIEKINKMNIIIAAGENDITLEENKKLSNVLYKKLLRHQLDVIPGANNNWPWWRHMFYKIINELEY